MHEIATKYPRAAAIIGAVILFFVIGMAVTTIAANYHNNTAETAPEPATTATETVTETKTVYRQPKACKTALTAADTMDEAHGKYQRAEAYVSAYTATGQTAELREAERTADRLADELTTARADYEAARDTCKEQ